MSFETDGNQQYFKLFSCLKNVLMLWGPPSPEINIKAYAFIPVCSLSGSCCSFLCCCITHLVLCVCVTAFCYSAVSCLVWVMPQNVAYKHVYK